MQYGVFAANYRSRRRTSRASSCPNAAPALSEAVRLTIAPQRLQQIRNERRPGSRYASLPQCEFEVRCAETLFQRHGVPASTRRVLHRGDREPRHRPQGHRAQAASLTVLRAVRRVTVAEICCAIFGR